MTDDIVERIDKWAKGDDVEWQDELLRDAKAEIEQLRAVQFRSEKAEIAELRVANATLYLEIERLQEALWQAVDDFGAGHCVCEETKQQCIAALEPKP